jgi:polysaccharide export outer membrane protein
MPRIPVRSVAWLLLLLACSSALLPACGSGLGGAIPVEQFKDEGDASAEYIIGIGDVLSIQVFDQPQMSGRMPVRSDGRISLPFVNDVEAAGKTPTRLAADLEAGLKSVVLAPRVTIVVEQSRPLTISVLGEVGKPGPLPFEAGLGVAQALAAAGGLTNFAHKDRIFVVRTNPKPARIHFTYDAIIKNVGAAATFRLKPADVIVVE